MNNYTERKKCIFCLSDLKTQLFESDLKNYVAHYAVDKEVEKFDCIPYNVLVCDNCKTYQTKYLGDINEVYRINHADGTGITMQKMHEKKLDLILNHKDQVDGIIEIGSSKGILCDQILDNLDVNYFIVEPSYFGNSDNRTIINDYYENVDDSKIEANTIVMSHVFEHFYEPLKILEKISSNKNIKNIFLTFPNLEKYISEGIHHVLNTEHTFYIDNKFVEKIFLKYGFKLEDIEFYNHHSVLFYFKRNDELSADSILIKNEENNVDDYFKKIYEAVSYFNNIIENNKDKNIYLFPASCHSIFLTIFGLNYQNIFGMVDNSPNKIGKKMYGLELNIFSFKKILEEDKKALFLINGGVFNKEIEQILIDYNSEYYFY